MTKVQRPFTGGESQRRWRDVLTRSPRIGGGWPPAPSVDSGESAREAALSWARGGRLSPPAAPRQAHSPGPSSDAGQKVHSGQADLLRSHRCHMVEAVGGMQLFLTPGPLLGQQLASPGSHHEKCSCWFSESQLKDNPAFSMLNDSDDDVIYG